MHPLGNDLSTLSDEDLYKKQNELNKRFVQAHRLGPQQIIPQLQILINDYQEEIRRRQARAMQEMSEKLDKDKKNKNKKDSFDI
jgi:hypothetical protein